MTLIFLLVPKVIVIIVFQTNDCVQVVAISHWLGANRLLWLFSYCAACMNAWKSRTGRLWIYPHKPKSVLWEAEVILGIVWAISQWHYSSTEITAVTGVSRQHSWVQIALFDKKVFLAHRNHWGVEDEIGTELTVDPPQTASLAVAKLR